MQQGGLFCFRFCLGVRQVGDNDGGEDDHASADHPQGHPLMEDLLYYNHLMGHLKWNNLGHVLAGGNGDIGDIEGKPEVSAAYELGRSID